MVCRQTRLEPTSASTTLQPETPSLASDACGTSAPATTARATVPARKRLERALFEIIEICLHWSDGWAPGCAGLRAASSRTLRSKEIAGAIAVCHCSLVG